LKKFKILHI